MASAQADLTTSQVVSPKPNDTFLKLKCGAHGCLSAPSTGSSPFECTKCRYTTYCSQVCQQSDWIHHRTQCSPFFFASENNDDAARKPFCKIVEKELFYLLSYSSADGEITYAARNALRLGLPGELRKTHALHVHFEYTGPENLARTASRLDVIALRKHFRFNHATVEDFVRGDENGPPGDGKTTFDTAMGHSKFMRKCFQRLVDGHSLSINYLLRATLTFPTIPTYHSTFYLFATHGQPLEWAIRPPQDMPINPDWHERLKRGFEDVIAPISTSQIRSLRLFAADCGLPDSKLGDVLGMAARNKEAGHTWDMFSSLDR